MIIQWISVFKICSPLSSFATIVLNVFVMVESHTSLALWYDWGEGSWGHTQKCLGITPGSVLRVRSHWGSRDHALLGRKSGSVACEARALTSVLSRAHDMVFLRGTADQRLDVRLQCLLTYSQSLPMSTLLSLCLCMLRQALLIEFSCDAPWGDDRTHDCRGWTF